MAFGDSLSLSRKNTVTGNRFKWTVSMWIRRGEFNGSSISRYLFGAFEGGPSGFDGLRFNDDDGGDSLRCLLYDGASNNNFINYDKRRDNSDWLHIVMAVDTSLTDEEDNQASPNKSYAHDRIKLYINGKRAVKTGGNSTQNAGTPVGVKTQHWNNMRAINTLFNYNTDSAAYAFQGEAFDVYNVDGQTLLPTDFGYWRPNRAHCSVGSTLASNTQEGQWVPMKPSSVKARINNNGGFGPNGFYLPLNDSTMMGADHHCDYDTILKLNEDLPQPKVGIARTSSGAGIGYTDVVRDNSSRWSGLKWEGATFFGAVTGTSHPYLALSDHEDYEFGSGAFTIEAWIFPTETGPRSDGSANNVGCIYTKGVPIQVFWNQSSQRIEYYMSSNGSSYDITNGSATGTNSVPRGEWCHWAFVRSGNDFKTYLNGTLSDTFTSSATMYNDSSAPAIGEYSPDLAEYTYKGLISNFRIVKGTAVYTSDFTPSTTPLTNITNTKLLCCQSATDPTEAAVVPSGTSITAANDVFATKNEVTGCTVLAMPFVTGGLASGLGDYSHIIRGHGAAKTFTNNNSLGIAVTASPYGSAAGNFTASQYLSFAADIKDFQPDKQDFTAECWFNCNDNNQSGIMGKYNTANNRRTYLLLTNQTAASFGETGWIVSQDGASTGKSLYPGVGISSDRQWQHIAGVKKGTTSSIFLNGKRVGFATDGITEFLANTTDSFMIGGSDYDIANGSRFKGFLQDVRLYKGLAKYDGDFDCPLPYQGPRCNQAGIQTFRVRDQSGANSSVMNKFAKPSVIDASSHNLNFRATGYEVVTNASAANWWGSRATVGLQTGKWYYEAVVVGGDNIFIGICTDCNLQGSNNAHDAPFNYSIRMSGSATRPSGAPAKPVVIGTQAAYSVGDVVGMSVVIDGSGPVGGGGSITFYKNGTYNCALASTHITAEFANGNQGFYPFWGGGSVTGQGFAWNFGDNPSFNARITSNVGGYSDENGRGSFRYQPPAGCLALCSENLPTPAIEDPGKHVKAITYSPKAEGVNKVTGLGFKPDLVVIKSRMYAEDFQCTDSVRGATWGLQWNNNGSEDAQPNGLMSFDDDGFTVGNLSDYAYDGDHLVAWCWKAGNKTINNEDGTIQSKVSVNKDAGFSIVSYTGSGTVSDTVGHGLGRIPRMIIVKERGGTSQWQIKVASMATNNAVLFTSGSQQDVTTAFASGGLGALDNRLTFDFLAGHNGGVANVNESGNPMIAYCWTDVPGFSKFGSYLGTGGVNGPMIDCGFKPAIVMLKQLTSGSRGWAIKDNARNTQNPVNKSLFPNVTTVEYNGFADTDHNMDFVSHGFKIRNTNSRFNESDKMYIYAAWAESPFQYATAR